jgi:predicted transcriptional regulator
MRKANPQPEIETLEEIKRLLILILSEQGVQGKRIAAVLGVDPAIVSRILSPKKPKANRS